MRILNLTLTLCLLWLCLTAASAAANVVDLRGAEAEQALAALRETIAAEPEQFDALRDAGIILHQISRRAPTKAQIEEGERYLKQARKQRANDLQTQAWLGSITTMKALFVSDPGKQTFFVKLGTRLMDSTVRKAPDDPILRLIRGHNSMELPVFLKRTRFAVDDFEHYLSLCGQLDCPPHEVELAQTRLAQARQIVAEQQ